MGAFQKWVDESGGVRVTAERLGLTPDAVHRWLRRQNGPSVKHIMQILKLADGGLTWEDIVSATCKLKNRGKTR